VNVFRIPTTDERQSELARQAITDSAREHGFDLALLRCGSRRADLVDARAAAAQGAYEATVVPLTEIARVLNRHVSTISRALRDRGVLA
jgi:hypothetical protein